MFWLGDFNKEGYIINMKIAVTYDREYNQIWQHFGHTEYFRIVTTENSRVISDKIVGTDGKIGRAHV